MKRLVSIVTTAILLIGSVLSGLSNTAISVAATSVPDNQVTSSVGEAGNSSARATIMITMYAAADE